MKELVFQGALDPHTPLAQGWLRVSHRKLDKKLTLPYRPYHTHDEEQKLKQGEVVRVRRRGLADLHRGAGGLPHGAHVRGKDYVYPGGARAGLKTLGTEWTGVGPFQHDDPRDRPAAVFGGDVTLHTGSRPQRLSVAADYSREITARRRRWRAPAVPAPPHARRCGDCRIRCNGTSSIPERCARRE